MPPVGEGPPMPGRGDPPSEKRTSRFDIGRFLVDFSARPDWASRDLMGSAISSYDSMGRQITAVFADAVGEFANGIGIGKDYPDYNHWLKARHRVSYLALVKREDKGMISLELAGSHHRHPYKPEIYLDKDTGFWLPAKDEFTNHGQHFFLHDTSPVNNPNYYGRMVEEYAPVLGRRKAELAFGKEGERYAIMEGTFLPNPGLSLSYPDGRAHMLYFWDRDEGALTLEGVKVSHLKTSSDPPEDSFSMPWEKVHAEDTNVVIKPFGVFRIPGSMSELEWFQNFMFPMTYEWSDARSGGTMAPNTYQYDSTRDIHGKLGFNIFQIEQMDTWLDFAGSIDKSYDYF
jgi:hypothetical protein